MEKSGAPRKELLGPMACQTTATIDATSATKKKRSKASIFLDRPYIAYMRSCMIAGGIALDAGLRVCI